MTTAAPYEASTIARWFLAWARFDEEGVISNLKLQKLLYYAQGHYIANHDGNPLFGDPIQAWGHGPVVPAVYHEFKKFGSNAIEFEDEFDFSSIDRDTSGWLAAVWKTHGARSAWALREMTHNEAPWKDTYQDGVRETTIPTAALERYFGSLWSEARPV
ncbi:DUF4065 domain-containing protein [Salinibacterium sp. G-O1]|uniref:Panacea domain-containing protein n=1 Tax=Salinibacterium sp. G-O1 TaxID=3046208 RepID=UPI0024BBA5A1|nr:type II toxin-antitoxin system antitoxin SocA domain-containing protein [Salinibacterium sp. G-O1]MDJ0334261.1 DUF4065 domain-containing protein [Salinibacterium sp. G-O1]